MPLRTCSISTSGMLCATDGGEAVGDAAGEAVGDPGGVLLLAGAADDVVGGAVVCVTAGWEEGKIL